MSGRRIIIPTTFTDASLPVLKDDPVLPASGALLLLDMATIDAGVPTPNAPLFNIAWRQAAAAIGSGTNATLAAIFKRSATFTASDGLFERTTKGGLHALISQSTLTSGRGAVVEAPDAIKAYMLANPSHSFYVSSWQKLTRASVGSTNAQRVKVAKYGNNWGKAVKMLYYRTGWWVSPTPSGAGNGVAGMPVNRFGPGSANVVGTIERLSAATVSPVPAPYYGTVTATTVVTPPTGTGDFTVGSIMGALDESGQNAPDLTGSPSFVLYRLYIEDLTVSGRPYATVDALDAAEHTKAFAVGGRFASDTHTSPTTIP